MSREYCAGCGGVRNMAATVTERTEKDEEGNQVRLVVTTYHCESCGRFVRSETRPA